MLENRILLIFLWVNYFVNLEFFKSLVFTKKTFLVTEILCVLLAFYLQVLFGVGGM